MPVPVRENQEKYINGHWSNRKGRILPACVSAVGGALPDGYITNHDLEFLVDTTDEWILERTGIAKRHIASGDCASSNLAAAASREAIEKAGVDSREVELLIVATVTPDMPLPSTACLVQEEIGAQNAACMDIAAGCTGFLYGLVVAAHMVSLGAYRNALVVGVDVLSRITDWEDRKTCVLFGDGAGAVLVEPSFNEPRILSFTLGSDGSKSELLHIPGGGSRIPVTEESLRKNLHTIKMDGRAVFQMAVRKMTDSILEVVEDSGYSLEQVGCLIPHQANVRIIESVCRRLSYPLERVAVNIREVGNTSAASIPLALLWAEKNGMVKNGGLCVLAGFGAGMTWGAACIRFGRPEP